MRDLKSRITVTADLNGKDEKTRRVEREDRACGAWAPAFRFDDAEGAVDVDVCVGAACDSAKMFGGRCHGAFGLASWISMAERRGDLASTMKSAARSGLKFLLSERSELTKQAFGVSWLEASSVRIDRFRDRIRSQDDERG